MKRHTYATNGVHMALGFSTGDGGGAVMGDEVCMEIGSEIQFDFHAICHGFFDRAELYVNNVLAKSYRHEPLQRNQVTEYRGSYRDAVKSGVTFYWVKVVQADGGTAWSSPIFVRGK